MMIRPKNTKIMIIKIRQEKAAVRRRILLNLERIVRK